MLPLWRGGVIGGGAVLLAGVLGLCAAQGDEPAQPKEKEPPKHTNRLAKETSPYLRLHAHNPVNWYPWGEEALAKAKAEKKLIFLSIGYSSCHWCHVMERESFMDDEIARHLNEHYVCIKVDREERPEIDTIYMTSLQVFLRLSGQGPGGGWPLSMFLTPDGEPFFGGTYFPARDGDRGRATGFLTVVKKVQEVWEREPDKIREDAGTLTKYVRQQLEQRPLIALEPVTAESLDGIHVALWEAFDPKYGGFGFDEDQPNSPKFPEPPNLAFLLDRLRRKAGSDELQMQARTMLLLTLDKMQDGGIYDHLGGGFHRYTVDRNWKIPHFEKMLYDNAQLASMYAEAYALTGHERYARVVRETLSFVEREMTDPEGAFYAALDAESEGEEGKYYRWTAEELQQALTKEEFELAAPIYSFAGEPNFEEKYFCLQRSAPLEELAKERGLSEEALEQRLAPIRAKLLALRAKRERPRTDDKVLTATNGLMIRGYADAGRILKEPKYVAAAERAATVVLDRLRTKEGRLLRTYARGEAKLNGYLEDYAFLADGLLALHRATGDKKWLTAADELTGKQIELFWDDKQGGFYFTSSDHESLIARAKEFADNVQPSANTVSAMNLLTLADSLERPEYRERAERTLRAGSGVLQRSPLLVPQMGVPLARWLEAKE